MKFKLLKSFNITTKTDRTDLQKILNDIQVIKFEISDEGWDSYHIDAVCKQGDAFYDVSLRVEYNRVEHYYSECNCKEFNPYSLRKYCPHILAVCDFLEGKEAQDYEWENTYEMQGYAAYKRKKELEFLRMQSKHALDKLYKKKQQVHEKTINSCLDTKIYSIEINKEGSGFQDFRVGFKVGCEKKYVIKDIPNFVQAVERKQYVKYGKNLAFVHDIEKFDEHSKKIIHFMEKCIMMDREFLSGRYLYPLNSYEITDTFYDIMYPKKPAEEMKFCVGVTKEEDLLCFEKRNTEFIIGGENYFYKFKDGELVRFHASFFELLELFIIQTQERLFVSLDDYPEFYDKILRHIQANLNIVEGEDLLPQIKTENFIVHKPELYGDVYDADTISFQPVAYDEQEQKVALLTNQNYETNANIEILLSVLDEKSVYKDKEENAFFMNIDEDDTISFLQNNVPALQKICDVYVSDALKKLGKKTNYTITTGVYLNNNLLEISFHTEDFDMKEIGTILKAMKKKKRYTRLKSGQILHLESEQLEDIESLLEDYDLSEKNIKNGTLKLDAFHSLSLDERLKENSSLKINRDEALKQYIENFQNNKIRYTVNEDYMDILRDYQKIGVKWLLTMYQYKFNGILADEMGLGKTLQVICMLDSVKDDGKQFLVVAPASLIYNWQDEIQKFSKTLSSCIITGNKEHRKNLIHHTEDVDVYITSYDYLRNDIEEYKDIMFDTIILDEAQNIKNQKTKNAECVKQLQATHRFALSGTPIENALSELWSIFDFLMPGYLFSYAHFRKHYEIPIVSKQDEKANKALKRLVSPFILRRTKKDVLTELPDKVDHQYLIDFSEEEKKLYFANAMQVNKELKQKLDQNSIGKIEILAMLTRLRQICCDPRLVFEGIKTPSSKLQACIDLVNTLHENNKKILIFSSFTSLMDLLAQELDKQKLPYYMLTGSTNKEKRREMVEAFQKDDTPIFLISLKAGGTGLNLTAAEAVIHIDPWWNVSAQNQATDRAHRIGQNANVQVYRMIMKDSIEEKIEKLQQQKKDLADSFVEGNDGSLSTMSKADILDLFAHKE